jgi:hypothetical protein
MARALRQELRKDWLLLDERKLAFTGPDWLVLLLNELDKETKSRVLLLFWRAWHLRNDLIHGKGSGSVPGSVAFLKSYLDSLQVAHQGSQAGLDRKGKAPSSPELLQSKELTS